MVDLLPLTLGQMRSKMSKSRRPQTAGSVGLVVVVSNIVDFLRTPFGIDDVFTCLISYTLLTVLALLLCQAQPVVFSRFLDSDLPPQLADIEPIPLHRENKLPLVRAASTPQRQYVRHVSPIRCTESNYGVTNILVDNDDETLIGFTVQLPKYRVTFTGPNHWTRVRILP